MGSNSSLFGALGPVPPEADASRQAALARRLAAHAAQQQCSPTRSAADEMAQRQLAALKEILTHGYGAATAYTNVILVAGYAAFYTTWGFMRDTLSPAAMAWAGLLITVSAMVFVSFEIFRMVVSSLAYRGLAARMMANPAAIDVIAEHARIEQGLALKFYRVWFLQIVPAVTTGFIATLILLYAFIQQLAGLM